MINSDELKIFLDKLMIYDQNFKVDSIDPYMGNDLIFKGEDKIEKIAFAVSASLETFKLAVNCGAQALITHHAINFPTRVKYDRLFQNRYAFLVKNNLNFFAYHFLLDSHPKIGHNVEIIKILKGKVEKPFLHSGNPWGYFGLVNNLTIEDVKKTFSGLFSPKMTIYPYGPEKIKRIVAISGRGTPIPPDIQYLIDNKVDAFITGEDSEWIREIFREVGIHYIAGGHYHTEKLGILALQKEVEKNLKVKTEFIDLNNNT